MIETKRLIIRKIETSDLNSIFVNYWSQEEAARYMQWDITEDFEDAYERIQKTIEFQKKYPHTYVIEEKASHQVIGSIGFIEETRDNFFDCGIGIGPKYWGNGYGKEATKAVMDDIDGLHYYIGTRIENEACKKMLKSLGFHLSYTQTNADPKTHTPCTIEFYEKSF